MSENSHNLVLVFSQVLDYVWDEITPALMGGTKGGTTWKNIQHLDKDHKVSSCRHGILRNLG